MGVPEEEGALAKVLLGGVSKGTPEVTVTDAFKAYLAEKAHAIPDQQRKQQQRFARSEKNLIFILGGDRPLSSVKRSDARAWRDMRLGQVSPATVKRERNDIAAVFSWAVSEMDGAGEVNPFKGMKLEAATEGRRDQRLPLDQGVIDKVYEDLKPHKDLLQIWTLLDHTGARDGEIRMLLASEVIIDDPIPHIIIEPRLDRTLKSNWSERKIPLIGAALDAAKEATHGLRADEYVFRRYATAGGLDRLSQALNRRIREHSDNPKHVAYSLRHNMKDRMRVAEVFPEKQRRLRATLLALVRMDHTEGVTRWSNSGRPLKRPSKVIARMSKVILKGAIAVGLIVCSLAVVSMISRGLDGYALVWGVLALGLIYEWRQL